MLQPDRRVSFSETPLNSSWLSLPMAIISMTLAPLLCNLASRLGFFHTGAAWLSIWHKSPISHFAERHEGDHWDPRIQPDPPAHQSHGRSGRRGPVNQGKKWWRHPMVSQWELMVDLVLKEHETQQLLSHNLTIQSQNVCTAITRLRPENKRRSKCCNSRTENANTALVDVKNRTIGALFVPQFCSDVFFNPGIYSC